MKKRVLLIILAVIAVITISTIVATDFYTSKSSFCGSCHVMKSYYNSWKTSKHGEKNIACVDCHYARIEKSDLDANFKGIKQFLTYFTTYGRNVRVPSKTDDRSCMTSDCHPKQKFLNKEIKFTEKMSYIHKTHSDITIEGQKYHCDTCHQNVTLEKHFEVSKEVCFLCHFINTNFDEGLAKCSLCHEIPTKPLQSQKKEGTSPDEKPITHQSLAKAKVPCQSCHIDLIQGKGDVNNKLCFNCHNYSFNVGKKVGKKGIMHSEHVAGQHVAGQLAQCFDCHEPIRHQKTEFLDTMRLNCSVCHPDHHIYQKMLLVGKKREGVPEVPSLMYKVNTTCLGCHINEKVKDGEKVVHGSGKACVACHTEKHEGMAKEWKDKTEEELTYAKEIEKEAIDAINRAKENISKEKLDEAMAILEKGRDHLRIVEYGSGVHNKKYSIMLLDAAMNNFEDAIDLLAEKE